MRISKVLGSHFIWCFSTLMSPLNVVVPRLIVPKFSPLTRTAHDNSHQKLGNVLKIFLSKRQTEIVAYFRHVTSLVDFSGMRRPPSHGPGQSQCSLKVVLRNLVCDIFAESQFCVEFTCIFNPSWLIEKRGECRHFSDHTRHRIKPGRKFYSVPLKVCPFGSHAVAV